MNNKDKESKIFLSIVIPAFNEEKRLSRALIPTIEFLKKQTYSSEIIVVNDGSTDNTKGAAEFFIKEFPALRVVEYFPNRGKGYAVKTGMLAAKGEYRLFMDADYAVPIQFVSTFLSMINHNYDLVIASRGFRQSQVEVHQPFFRELAAKTFGEIQRIVLCLPFLDTNCGFKLFTRETAENLFSQLKFDCAYFDAELLFMAYQSKMQVGEIGVRWRHDGETRLPIGIIRTLDIIKKMFMIHQLHRNLNR